MLKNYIKVALRNLIRQKLYVAVNILGLSIALSICLLIIGLVHNELTFEECHDNRDRIYRVDGIYSVGEYSVSMAPIMSGLGPVLPEVCPDVEKSVRIRHIGESPVEFSSETIIQAEHLLAAEQNIFDIFTLPLKEGNPGTALAAPYSVVISKKVADTYYPNENSLGKYIVLFDSMTFTITGVLEEQPSNTQIRSDYFLSYSTLSKIGFETESWTNLLSDYTYVLMRPGADPSNTEALFAGIFEKNVEPEYKNRFNLRFNPLNDIYLYSDLSNEFDPHGSPRNIYIFSSIALLILIIASINFINLSTARTTHRTKEVGIRKVLGAFRGQLIGQFITESVILTTISLMVSFVWFEIGRPVLESFIERDLTFTVFTNPILIAASITMILVVGIVSGSYPALALSRYRPSVVLRLKSKMSSSKSVLRRFLVVFQFTIAITLIAATMAAYKQIDYSLSSDPGFDNKNMLVLELDSEVTIEKANLLKQRILSTGISDKVTKMGSPPGAAYLSLFSVQPENSPEGQMTMMHGVNVGYDYFENLGLELVEGRTFSRDISGDTIDAIIINEAAVREYNIENPIGFRFIRRNSEFRVIGVMKDFHIHTYKREIMPTLLTMSMDNTGLIGVKLSPDEIPTSVAGIKDVWNEIFPDRRLNYRFLDSFISESYQDEQKISTLFMAFSLIAIFVACLGLFGLTAFMAEQKTKEIGIRKVLGASVTSLIHLLFREHILLIGVSNIIAWPIAYYLISYWLESFAYRTDIGIVLFGAAGLLTLLIALSTISFQAVKAAVANPIDAIKHE